MFRKYFFLASVLAFASFITRPLSAEYPAVATGGWAPANSLTTARSGGTATILQDGRVLFAGGFDVSGNPLSSTEIIGTDGSVSAGPPMNVARANQAAILLKNGDVLVAGGVTTGGAAADSAEIFDPAQNVWTRVPSMAQGRAGHTLSLLADGSILVAGGTNGAGPVGLLERFDPTQQTFSAAGSLATPRSQAATAVLSDGRVMIIGGMDANSSALSSTEIYDPSAGTVTPGPSLNTARYGHTATTSLTGVVVVIGGANPALTANGGTAELNIVELFDPSASTPAFVPSASHLNTARTGHLAFLLPHNNNILVVAGTAAGAQLSSAELYTPWLDQLQTAGSMSTARADAAGTALLSSAGNGTDGVLLAGSGQNSTDGTLSSTELYGFATVKTDRNDYAPGDVVMITGSGWQPGETVELELREFPNIDRPGPYYTVVDASGNILDMEFAPDLNDAGIRFYLTAIGPNSGLQAQHTFTDSVPSTTVLSCTPSTVVIGQSTSCTATTTAGNSSFEGTITFSVSPSTAGSFSPTSCDTGTGPTKSFVCTTTYTPSSTVSQILTASFSSSNPGKVNSGSSNSVTITVTPDLSLDVPSPDPVLYGSAGPVTFTAHLTNGTSAIANATVTFTVGGTVVGTAVTDGTGTAAFSTYNPSSLSVGDHTVQASFAGGTIGGTTYNAAASNQQTLTVEQISTTTAISAPAITYGQDGTVTVTVSSGVGNPTPTGNVSLSFNGGTAVAKALDSTGSAIFTSADIAGLATPAANVSGYPLSASYAAQDGFAASNGTGTLVVNPLAVTLTAGSYSGTYDGQTHPLSDCTSSVPSFVTCTNSPAGPVGPDVSSNNIVTPTANFVQGNSGDYTITSNNGSWSITALAVTLSAGSYSGTYDGSTHALSACNSSAPAFVTCTNNPTGPVGPDVNVGGPTAVVPVPSVGSGIAADYDIKTVNGSWSITPLGVTLTAGSLNAIYNGSAQSPSACSSSQSTFVTCTNNPNSVGPNVVTAATITPMPNYVQGVPADYSLTSNTGTATITALTVTVTGGSYSGVYDGGTHALSACNSTYAGVTCTNNPTGPVGPDVNVGGPTAVVPVPSVGSGIAADYDIKTVNGSWSITPLGVTLTAGSLINAVYNGSTQSPSACSSSQSTFVTCTNNPNSVGPDVGSGIVMPTPGYAPGSIAGDFTITSNNGSWSIIPMRTTVTLTVPSTQYSDPDTFSGSVGLAGIAPAISGVVTVTAHNGTATISCTSAATAGGTYSCTTDPIMWGPGAYAISAVFTPTSSNYSAGTTPVPVSLRVTQEDAAITYTGQSYFTSTTSTTSVTVTFLLQDASATQTNSPIYDLWPGDITKAAVLAPLTLMTTTNSNVATCTPSLVATGAIGSTGLPSAATISCTFSNVPVPNTYTLSVSPGSGSYYAFTGGGDQTITITTATGGTGFITGGGYQTAGYLMQAGIAGSNKYTDAGLLLPAPGTKVNFGFEAKYQNNNKNLQGGVNLIIRSQCLSTAPPGFPQYQAKPMPGNICVYQVKVPQGQLTSMSENLPPNSKYPYAQLAGGANIYDITWPTNVQQIANSKTAILQMQMYDVGDPGPGANVDPLSIQVTDSTMGIWFSNNENGSSTVLSLTKVTTPTTSSTTAPLIQGGDLQVH